MGHGVHDRRYDVIVVGLGGMGSAAAYHLARRHQRVLGLDRFGPAHDRGSSHGGFRIIRMAYYEDPAYVPLLMSAYELWRRLEQDCGSALLFQTGGLLLGPPGARTVAGALCSADEWDLTGEVLDARTLRRRFPTLAPEDDTVAFYEEGAGVVGCEATVRAHLRLAAAEGAELRFDEAVVSWEASPADDGVVVHTRAGRYRADRMVLCPGAWAPGLLCGLEMHLRVQRQVQTWFQPDGGVDPFLPDRHPWWLWEPEGDRDAGGGFEGFTYGFPAMDGPDGGMKMGICTEPDPSTPDAIDRTVTTEEVDQVAVHLRRRLAIDPGRFLRADTCMFENTPDYHFVIGPHPLHPQVSVAAGFSGHGFKFVPVIGQILADLAIDGKTALPLDLFDPNRFGPHRVT